MNSSAIFQVLVSDAEKNAKSSARHFRSQTSKGSKDWIENGSLIVRYYLFFTFEYFTLHYYLK